MVDNITLPRISDNGRLTDPSQVRSHNFAPPQQVPTPSPRGAGSTPRGSTPSGGRQGFGLRRLVSGAQPPNFSEASRPPAEREGRPAPRRPQLHREDFASPSFGDLSFADTSLAREAREAPQGLDYGGSSGSRPAFQSNCGSPNAFQYEGRSEVRDVMEAIGGFYLHTVFGGTGPDDPPCVVGSTSPNAGPRHVRDIPSEADAVLLLCYAEQRQPMVDALRSLIKNLKGVAASMPIFVLLLRPGNFDSSLVAPASTRLLKDGADHVMLQPRDKLDLEEMIAAALGTQRVRSGKLQQLQEQIDARYNSLFYESADQIIRGFPKIDLRLEEMPPTRGSRGAVGQHVFTGTIGEGRFGKVYLTSSSQAVKVISKRTIKTLSHCSQIFKECQLLHRARHPNIAEFCKLVHAKWNIYIFMEYVGKTDLYVFIKKSQHGRLESAHVLELFLQICEAVAHCHQVLIAHRDIKSENVVVNEEGIPKLVDFGLAIQLTDADPPKLCEDRCGTIPFAPPEVCRGKKYEARAMDIWSLGILTLEMRYGNDSVCRMLELAGETEPSVELAQVIERFFSHPDWPINCIKRNDGIGMAEELLSVLRGCLVVTPDLRWGAADLWDHIANSEAMERITGRMSERFTTRSHATDYDARPTDAMPGFVGDNIGPLGSDSQVIQGFVAS